MKNGLRIVLDVEDPKCVGLDINELLNLCLCGETIGLAHKSVTDINDGEHVTVELHFEERILLSEWVESKLPKCYYKVATQI